MEPASVGTEPLAAPRARSGTAFPVYDLADSLVVPKLIHEKGGGSANDDQLATYLSYKSPRNGAYLGRVGAAKLFGLITGGAHQFAPSALAQKILMPIYEGQTQEGLVEAFLNVPLFRGVYEECKGKELPPEFGMKNLLRQKFQIIPARLGNAYRVLMDSADAAGFFATRGARTHLILPTVARGTNQPDSRENEPEYPPADLGGTGGSGGDSGRGNGSQPTGMDDLRREYVSMLMDLLREKAKSGESDPDLMERIEKLLALNV